FKVHALCAGKTRTWEVDRLIANVGYSPENTLYRELQVLECYATFGPLNVASALLKSPSGDGVSAAPVGAAALRNPEPHFFILAAKSYGRNSSFLLRAGFEQVRDVFGLIVGNTELISRFPALRQIKSRLGTVS